MDFVRTLKALADPLRLRVLAAVAEEELTVGEVQEVVASMQSSVSRNLAMLREAGFVQDRKEGTSVYFSVRADMPEPARELFKSLQTRFGEIPEIKKDQGALGRMPPPPSAPLAELFRVGGRRLGADSQELLRRSRYLAGDRETAAAQS